jgi:hypothetical protein
MIYCFFKWNKNGGKLFKVFLLPPTSCHFSIVGGVQSVSFGRIDPRQKSVQLITGIGVLHYHYAILFDKIPTG